MPEAIETRPQDMPLEIPLRSTLTFDSILEVMKKMGITDLRLTGLRIETTSWDGRDLHVRIEFDIEHTVSKFTCAPQMPSAV